MRPIVLALPLVLAGCGAASQGGPQADGTSPPPSAPAPAEPSRPTYPASAVPEGSQPIATARALAGEYRVAGIDGTELQGNIGIGVSIDGSMVSFEPKCAGFVWTIAEQGGRFAFARAPGYGPTRQPDGSIMVCAVAVSPEQRRLAQAIDRVSRAWRTPSNGILLEGGGRSVLLFSQ